MFCPSCGAQNDDNAYKCVQCGAVLRSGGAAGPPAAQVPNYLVQSILVTLFCCLPFGIVAIVYASQVNSKLAIGDVKGAIAASNSAKTWSWVSFGLGLAVTVAYIGLMIIGGIAANQH